MEHRACLAGGVPRRHRRARRCSAAGVGKSRHCDVRRLDGGIAGGWFVVGRTLASTLRLGDLGHPIGATDAKRAAIEIASFSGLGALIVFISGAVLARVSARMARDVAFAPTAEPMPARYAHDAFTENDAATVLAPSAPRKHRRKGKGGLFRRRSVPATSH